MRLLQRADVTREAEQVIAERAQYLTIHAECVDEIRMLRRRISELETGASTRSLVSSPPPATESEMVTALRREVEQLKRNAVTLSNQLAAAEGRDTRIRMGGWTR